jgi:1-acyl-sn-glycerol-3-phosphate acyltransferase
MIAAWLIRLITGAQARWVGVGPLRADGSIPQRIYFANHQSHLDAPVIWASLPGPLRRRTRPVAARDYWQSGRLRPWLAQRVFGAVLIERQNVTRRNNPLAPMDRALDGGDSLIVFPEGTRQAEDEGDIQAFKPGLYHLARRRPEVELVPVHLENLNRILPKGDFLLIPLLAAVTFGRPIHLEKDEPRHVFLMRARNAVRDLSAEAEAKP